MSDAIPLALCAALLLHFVVFALLLADLKRRKTAPGAPWKYWLGSIAGDAAVAAAVAGYLGTPTWAPTLIGAGAGLLFGGALARLVARERAVRAHLAARARPERRSRSTSAR